MFCFKPKIAKFTGILARAGFLRQLRSDYGERQTHLQTHMLSRAYKVLVTRRIPTEATDILALNCSIDTWDSDERIPDEVLEKRIVGVDGLYCLLTDKINEEVLNAAGENLRVVSTMSVGIDHIDLQECKRRKISVGYTPDVLTSATAEFTVALLLATSRRIVEGVSKAKNGEWGTWKPTWLCGPSIEGSTIGIVGLGRIGIAIVQRLRPFNPRKFLYNNARKKSSEEEQELGVDYVTFPELLSESDFVICCCALTPQTSKLFNTDAFDRMKRTAVFVNTSRGGVVNQDDLYEALTEKKIAAAGIDVTDPEPLPTNHKLFGLKNCVITPHIASASLQTRTTMSILAARNLIAGLEGERMPARYQY